MFYPEVIDKEEARARPATKARRREPSSNPWRPVRRGSRFHERCERRTRRAGRRSCWHRLIAWRRPVTTTERNISSPTLPLSRERIYPRPQSRDERATGARPDAPAAATWFDRAALGAADSGKSIVGAVYRFAMLFTMASFEVFVATVLTLLVLATSYWPPWKYLTRRLRKKCSTRVKTVQDVPGPVSLPIIGTSWVFYTFSRYRIEKLHDMYKDMRRRYGPLCKQESYWNWPIVSVFDCRDIEAIVKRTSRYPLRPPQDIISHYRQSRTDRYASLGLVNEQGVTWQKLRATLTPELMGAKTILGFFPALNGVTDDFIDLIRSRRTGCSVIGFEELAYRMGLESTCMLMLGRHLGFLQPDSVSTLTNRLAEAVRLHFLALRDAFYGFPFWKLFATSAYKNLIFSEESIYDIISDLIETTLWQHHESAKDEDIEAVFLSILREKSLDMREKKAAIIDFIAAGIHTVGNTLVFLLHTLGRNPEVQRRLREEADSLAPPRCDISIEVLKNTKYIQAFITEVFRLLPTAPCIARILEEPATLSGYDLKAGTVVLLHTWIAGLDEENFKHADKCIPERWLHPEQYQPHSPLLVAPFGFGRRICPGKRFVEQALQLMVAKIVREFEIVADEDLGLQFEYIMAPKGPVKLSFLERVDAT